VHENRAECLFSLLKPYLRVFRGIGKINLPGYLGFFQFLAKRCLATAGSTPEPVIEPTRDEANNATPVVWPGPLVVPRPPGEA
jgi:hypothetical protein